MIELINLASSCSCTFICLWAPVMCYTYCLSDTYFIHEHIHSIHARIANINEEQAGHWQTDLHSGQSWDGSHDDCDCSFKLSLVLSEHNKIPTDCGQYGCAYFDFCDYSVAKLTVMNPCMPGFGGMITVEKSNICWLMEENSISNNTWYHKSTSNNIQLILRWTVLKVGLKWSCQIVNY